MARLMDFDDVNRLIGEMMSGLSTRYNLGSEWGEAGRLIGNRSIGRVDHDGSGGADSNDASLYDFMQDGRSVFLDASADRKASRLIANAAQRIRCVAVETGPSMLIRPDACVAWVGEENGCADGLEEALHRWFIPALHDGSTPGHSAFH